VPSQTIPEISVPLSGRAEGSADHSAQETVITNGEANTPTHPGPASSNHAEESDAENSEEELGECPMLFVLCR
jgi:hypothetical protein